MVLFQRLGRLRKAYNDGKEEARLEDLFRFAVSFSTEPERTALSESHKKTRRAFIVGNIPEEGSLERSFYDFRYTMGSLGYFLREMVD